MAAVLHAAFSLFFFWSVNSLLFSIGIQWISDVVQVTGTRFSYTQTFIPFRVLFRISVIIVCSINFPMLFSGYFKSDI